MNLVALQKEIDRLDKELALISDYQKKRLLDVRGELDRIRLECAALREFLEEVFPEFKTRFPAIHARIIRERNPELD
jgi:hypothetical protein